MAKKKLVAKKITKKINLKNFWFKKIDDNADSKWGFIPINWKGWTALSLLIAVNVFAANYFDIRNSLFNGMSRFLVVFLLSISVFVLIAQRKTNK